MSFLEPGRQRRGTQRRIAILWAVATVLALLIAVGIVAKAF
jgi:hypothetical protein